jgi:hypothetical protein
MTTLLVWLTIWFWAGATALLIVGGMVALADRTELGATEA